MMMIPKIIHQVWEGRNGALPGFCMQWSDTWKEHHPGWRYEFWNGDRMEAFVKKHYPHLEDAYFGFQYNVQRWNVIRYLILFEMGGMYVDFDYKCLESVDKHVAGHGKCYFAMEPGEHCVNFFGQDTFNHALMAACPRHPFFKKIIDHIFFESQYACRGIKVLDVHATTGPVMLTELYRAYPHKDEIVLWPEELVSPWSELEARSAMDGTADVAYLEKKLEKAIAVHYFSGSWTY